MSSASTSCSSTGVSLRRRCPATLVLGLAWIALCEVLLFTDVYLHSRGALRSDQAIIAYRQNVPGTPLGQVARWVAANMTPLVWVGYVMLLDGILALQRQGSPVRQRPHHFVLLSLASVFIWCVFDWVNFYYIRAWEYIGMPPEFFQRAWGYFISFAAIAPGMLMSGQVLLNQGWFDWARSASWRMPRWAKWAALAAGAAMFIWPLVHPDPVTNLTLWASLVFLLDPINQKLGRPSMFRDWQNGWYGRTLAAFAGGLLCGFLWEFWNFWALTKWTYHLPFLGASQGLRYFEMPVIGLLGFLPFGQEAWVMWQSMRIPLDGLAEPLPDEKTLL